MTAFSNFARRFSSIVVAIAEVYAEYIERVGRGERLGGTPQAPKGRLYQVKHRQLSHERALQRKLDAGFLREHVLPRRIKWFTDKPSGPTGAKTVRT